jgi:hypothetical protein
MNDYLHDHRGCNSVNEMAEEVALKFLEKLGQMRGEPAYQVCAPE